MRHLALVLLLAPALHADDGGKASANRWSHARGPASCSGESHAQPPESFGRIAWTYKAKGAVLFTPVVWDGAIFVVDGDSKRAELLALDVETGQVWARAATRAPGQPAAYSRSAFLVEDGKTIVQFGLVGRTFSRGWTYDAGEGVSSPRILDGEIYVTTPSGLLSLRAGMSRPAWKVAGSFQGEPAVRGDHVYALRRDGAKLLLCAYARTGGKEATSVALPETAAGAGGRIVLGNRIVAVLLPPEKEHAWALVSRKAGEGALELGFARTEKFLNDPLSGDYSLLAIAAEPRAWAVFYTEAKQARLDRVAAGARPELFEAPASAVWLGESFQCFGDWCGDIMTNVIYWHARERAEGAPLRKGLRFSAVPARDELLLFVPADGASILAIAPEEIR